MSSGGSTYCNRTPFLSDRECDRGSVDIHQFDDFPYCAPICPSQSEIPPEIVDTPIVVTTPLTCSCFNIDYDIKIDYGSNFYGNGTFKSKGDCCEGKYESDFDIKIPCPISCDEDKKVSFSVEYGDNEEKKHQEFSVVETNCDNDCTIRPIDAKVDLQIPCPLTDVDSKISIGIGYGETDGEPITQDLIKASHDSCSIEITSPSFDLKIPCPVQCDNENAKMKVGITYGESFNSVSSNIIKADPDGCTIDVEPAEFDLHIPCPIKGSQGSKITATYGWINDPQYDSTQLVKADAEACTIEPIDANLNFTMACPIVSNGNADLSISVGYGDGPSSVEKVIAKPDCERCTISVESADFNLNLPCPVDNIGGDITVGVAYGEEEQSQTKKIAQLDGECGIKVGADFDLNLPCPIKGGPGVITIFVDNEYNNSGPVTETIFTAKDCEFQAISPTFHLSLPCPWDNVQMLPGKVKAGRGGFNVTYSGDDNWTLTVDATFPASGLSSFCPINTSEGEGYISPDFSWGNNTKVKTKILTAKCSGITLLDANIALQLPCPVDETIKSASITVTPTWGKIEPETVDIVKATHCSIAAVTENANVSVSVPCPIDGISFKEGTVSFTKDKNSAKISVEKTSNTSGCSAEFTINATFPESIINVDCPIKESGEVKATASISYDTEQAKAVKIVEIKDCKISPPEDTVNIAFSVPCPIGGGGNLTLTPVWGKNSSSETTTGTVVKSNNCTLESVDSDIEIKVPCPISGSLIENGGIKIREGGTNTITVTKGSCNGGTYEISADISKEYVGAECPIKANGEKLNIQANVKFGNGGESITKKVLSTDKDTCTITPSDATFDLTIACPVSSSGSSKITVNPITITTGAGVSEAVSHKVFEKTGCGISLTDASYDLTLPCPLPNFKIENGTVTYGSGDEGHFDITKVSNNGCDGTTYKIDAVLPGTLAPDENECRMIDGETTATGEIVFGNETKGAEITLFTVDENTCKMSPASNDITLSVKCPMSGVITLELTGSYGEEKQQEEIDLSDMKTGSCEYTFGNVKHTISVDCPIKNLGFSDGTITFGDQLKASISGEDTKVINVTLPDPLATLFSGKISIATDSSSYDYSFDDSYIDKWWSDVEDRVCGGGPKKELDGCSLENPSNDKLTIVPKWVDDFPIDGYVESKDTVCGLTESTINVSNEFALNVPCPYIGSTSLILQIVNDDEAAEFFYSSQADLFAIESDGCRAVLIPYPPTIVLTHHYYGKHTYSVGTVSTGSTESFKDSVSVDNSTKTVNISLKLDGIPDMATTYNEIEWDIEWKDSDSSSSCTIRGNDYTTFWQEGILV